MPKYKKKPIVIEAVQLKEDNIREIESFIKGKDIKLESRMEIEKFTQYEDIVLKEGRKINTLEGTMTASIGDYIIKGVNGEFYPCKPDIFEKTYEPV